MPPVERARVIPFFKGVHLFAGLSDAQLSKAARYFKEKQLPAGSVIIKQNAAGDGFYFLMQGDVLVTRRVGDTQRNVTVLHEGEFFGEQALLRNQPRNATVKAINEVSLLYADKKHFDAFLGEFPAIRLLLERLIESRTFIERHPFAWLNPEERVYQVRRKHITFLLWKLLPPAAVLLLGLLVAWFTWTADLNATLRTGGYSVAGILAFAAILFGVWQYIDWSNDYYILTDQRVVWVEQIVFFYESTVQAPLEALRGINVKMTLLSRILGFGDIDISTYTSQFTLRAIGDPRQMELLIREFWREAQQRSVRTKRAEDERAVDKIIHPDRYDDSSAPESPQESPSDPKRQGRRPATTPGEVTDMSLSERYLGNLLRSRTELNGVVTYRKHWLVLLKKIWIPLLVQLLLLTGAGFGAWAAIRQDLGAGVLGIGGVLFLILSLGSLGALVYNYIDWTNDIYQITKDTIYDIEKKPFGDESRTSAPLDRVISLNHERRGLPGYLFNYGDVNVNVGDQKLNFEGVFDPARVQQDVFQRMQELQNSRKQQEVDRERDRVLAYLNIYHDIKQASERSD